MNKSFPVSIILVLLLWLSHYDAMCQWKKSDGPYAVYSTSIALYRSQLFLGVHYPTVYRSSDGGSHWLPLIIGQSSSSSKVFGSTASHLFMGDDNRTYRSSDGVNDWQQINTPFEWFLMMRSGNKFTYVSTNDGIYATSDDGDSWIPRNKGMEGMGMSSVFAEDSIVWAGSGYGKLFLSTDFGKEWKLIEKNFFNSRISGIERSGTAIIIAVRLAGFFRSTDWGETWEESNTGLLRKDVNSLMNDGFFYATTDTGGVYYSEDGCHTWRAANNGLTSLSTKSILHHQGNFFVCTSDQGVFKTTDSKWDWVESNSGMSDDYVFGIYKVGNTLMCITPECVFASPDGKGAWSRLTYNETSIHPESGVLVRDQLIVSAQEGIFSTSDFGRSWKHHSSFNLPGVLYSYQNILFAGVDGTGVYLSTDGGVNWTQTNGSFPSRVPGVRCFTSIGNKIFVGFVGWNASYPGIHVSTDDGMNWTSRNVGLPDSPNCYELLARGNDLYSIVNGWIYRSTDFGENWVEKIFGIPHAAITCLTSDANRIYAGVDSIGVVWSSDSGERWDLMESGLPKGSIRKIYFIDSTLFVHIPLKGIWYYDLRKNQTSVAGDPLTQRASKYLLTAYPNPFTTSTTIRYSLPSRGHVRLDVLDLLGRKIATLVEEEREAGEHTSNFDVRTSRFDLKSGVYFLRTTTRDGVVTRKLIVQP